MTLVSKIMSRLGVSFGWFGIVCLALPALNIRLSAEVEAPVLRILNWSGFIQLDDSLPEDLPIEERSPVLSSFASKNGCTVEYTEYDEPAELARMVMTLPNYFDVIVAGRKEMMELQSIGVVEKLDFGKLQNYRHIGREYTERMGSPLNNISIPYLLGTTGIAYRKDLVNAPIDSWVDFFEPHSSMKGKLGLTADKNLAFSLSLLSLGYHFQSDDADELRNAAVRINRLNQSGFFGIVSSNIKLVEQSLNSGEIAMAIMYSGDVLSAMERNPNIGYVVPVEGSEGYTDLVCLNRRSDNRDLAYQFLDYLMDPEVAADNSIYLNYASPNHAAVELIRKRAPELIENPAIYTPESIQGKLYEISRSSDEVTRYWAQIFR
ncbi:spermidine/putrescine ABC transporter substrate-binding protein [Puniceicoccaceae bacterium K14]|nr:spermidine/putrescine ABC transporter substrate-binding protein [Puniceicoccaceae bacterium K14]